MDNNLKLIEDYKDVKLIYEVQLRDESIKIGLFNLKTLKYRAENKSKVLVLQTSNPNYMPNYNISVQVFSSKLTKQKAKNKHIGFYEMVVAQNLKEGDILNISFDDNSRFDEAPFEIEEIGKSEVVLNCLINCTPYEKMVLLRKDFDLMLKRKEFLKYEPIDDDWFEEELDEWLTKLEEK